MTRRPFLARQGDVLIRQVQEIPAGAKEQPRDKGRVVLAYGEVTGHAHQLADPEAGILLTVAESATFLRLTKGTQLVHEEHSAIGLAPGMYEVVRQVEHRPWGIQQVAD